ncbi:RDD family protein [Candidatus Woesearchaeota archaeon]|nr:RDD family protein [Candidatus Woesearchaeota archaeon]
MPRKKKDSNDLDSSLNLPLRRMVVVEAPVWKRALALLADLVILDFIVLGAFNQIFNQLVPESSPFTIMQSIEQNSKILMLLSVTIFMIGLFMLAYFMVMEYMYGQTLGKMLFNIRVQPEAISWWQILVRNIAVLPVMPFVLLWVIDPLMLLFKKQRLSDQFAKTTVIEEIEVY